MTLQDGIQLMKENVKHEEIYSADFRVDGLHLDRVLSDLEKWIRTMPENVRYLDFLKMCKLERTLF